MDKGAERAATAAMSELDILRLMLSGAQDAIYAVALPEVRMLHASPAFPARLGLPPDFLERGFVFADYLGHVHPEDRERVQGLMDQVLSSRSDAELPENPACYRTGPAEGPWRHMEDNYRVLRAPDGSPTMIIGNSRDATGETTAREALRQSEEHYRLLVEAWPDQVMLTVNLTAGRHEYVSPSMERVLGYAPREFYDDPGLGLAVVAPHWLEEAHAWLDELRRGVVRPPFEFELVRKDGRTIWVNQVCWLRPRQPGQDIVVQFAFRDITEERNAREALRQSEERFRLLAESWHDQVVFRYQLPAMVHEYVSPSVERILGYRPEQFYSQDVAVLNAIPPEWRATIAGWMEENSRGILRPEYEYEVFDAWGRRRWLKQHGTLLRGPDGVPTAVQFLMADVTEHKRVEDELRRKDALLSAMLRNLPFDFWARDNAGHIIMQSDESVRLWGDLSGTGEQNLGFSEEVKAHWSDNNRRARAGEHVSEERALEIASGEVCTFHNIVSAIRDGDTVHGLLGVNIDITQRKRAETALRTSEERYALALRGASDGIWDWDLVTGTVYYSDRWKEIIGYGPDEIRHDSQEWMDRIHPDDYERVMAANGGCISGKEDVFQVEYRLRHKDGSYRWIFGRGAALTDREGRVVRMAGAHTDITARKDAEEAMRLLNERYALLVANVADVIWSTDAQLRWTFLTPSAEAMSGIPLERLMSMSFPEVFTPRSMQVVAQAMAERTDELQAGRGTEVHTLEMELVRADGSLVPLEVIVRPLMGPDGTLTGYCGTSRDISQRKAAEAALLRSERRSSELFRHSTDSINILTEEGLQVFVSGATQRMVGYDPSELVGIPVIETMIHPDDREAVQNAFAATLRHGVGRAQYRHRHRNGSWVHLEAWATNQLDNPDICGVVVNVRDITDRKMAEAALQRSERLFRKLLESMHEGVWAFDSRYRTIFANERLGAMLGYTLEELVGKAPWDITAPEQMGLVHRILAERRAGVAGTTEYTLLRKDGSRLLAQVTSSPLMDDEGRFEGQVCGIVDMTSRLRLEREVRRNQARLEALYELSRLTGATESQIASFTLEQAQALSESSAGVLFFVGSDGRTLEPRATNGAEIPGPPPRFLLESRNLWSQVAGSGLPVVVNEGRPEGIPLPGGHPDLRRFMGVPALDGGHCVAVLGLAGKAEPYDEADVLQLTLLVDGMWRIVRARRDEASIRASLREKEALLREVHHRVKNNLQVVSSLLDMSGRRLAEPEARQAMAEVQAKVQAMSLIHILLYGSSDVRGIGLGEYVGALFRQLREVYGGAGISLSAQLHLGGLVLGLDQAVPLGLALNEALANVFKHAASGAAGHSVEVRAEREGDGMVTLTVRDQGPGLPREVAPEGGAESSTGLGMRLMRGLVVHQLGGEFSVKNAPGGGVLVTLRFRPAAEHAQIH